MEVQEWWYNIDYQWVNIKLPQGITNSAEIVIVGAYVSIYNCLINKNR